MLANERTYAGWMRTGLASAGLGLGFNAIFRATEPTWLAKVVASVFIALSMFIFWSAWRQAAKIRGRLDSHKSSPLPKSRLGFMTGFFIFGSFSLGVVLWIL
ncbi:YidH family protein [Hyphococcus sp.]|uniref:YidH family protein n=1 Tax=Hyphococcus sp. TaxID=2038636 RepID=UPI003CCB8270